MSGLRGSYEGLPEGREGGRGAGWRGRRKRHQLVNNKKEPVKKGRGFKGVSFGAPFGLCVCVFCMIIATNQRVP